MKIKILGEEYNSLGIQPEKDSLITIMLTHYLNIPLSQAEQLMCLVANGKEVTIKQTNDTKLIESLTEYLQESDIPFRIEE